jgi:uncharacterized protein
MTYTQRIRLYGSLLVVGFIILVSATAGAAPAGGVTRIAFGTGSTGGLYFIAGSAVAKVLNEQMAGVINVSPQSTVGSAFATKKVDSKELEMALVTVDAADNGYKGLEEFRQKTENIRAVMAVMNLGTALVVLDNSPIKSVRDMKGKSIGANSAMEQKRIAGIMEQYQFGEKDYSIKMISYGEQANAMKDGSLAVAFLSAYPKNATVLDLFTTRGARMISIDPEQAAGFGKKYPYWTPFQMPASIYPKQDQPVRVASLRGLLIAHKDVDAKIIYEVVKTITGSTKELAAIHPVGADFTVDQTRQYLHDNLINIPWHPGAERFFKEKGVLR